MPTRATRRRVHPSSGQRQIGVTAGAPRRLGSQSRDRAANRLTRPVSPAARADITVPETEVLTVPESSAVGGGNRSARGASRGSIGDRGWRGRAPGPLEPTGSTPAPSSPRYRRHPHVAVARSSGIPGALPSAPW